MTVELLEELMSRIQLALNVDDLDAAIAFYSALFATRPHKIREGYANFAVSEPPLKLVLIEDHDAPAGSLNHLGVEVAVSDEVTAASDRLVAAGLGTDVRAAELCCHAVQDKVWVAGPGEERWEIYTVLDDLPDGFSTAEATCCDAAADTGSCSWVTPRQEGAPRCA